MEQEQKSGMTRYLSVNSRSDEITVMLDSGKEIKGILEDFYEEYELLRVRQGDVLVFIDINKTAAISLPDDEPVQ